MKINMGLMSVFICDEDTLAVLDKFLAISHVSNKINFQTYFANKPIRWFVFEAVQKTRNTHFEHYLKHVTYAK